MATFIAAGKIRGVMYKAPTVGKMHPLDARINRVIGSVSAMVERLLQVIRR